MISTSFQKMKRVEAVIGGRWNYKYNVIFEAICGGIINALVSGAKY